MVKRFLLLLSFPLTSPTEPRRGSREGRARGLDRRGRVPESFPGLWAQLMTFRGTLETDTGRMPVVFRKVGKAWKGIPLHPPPARPDPSRIPAPEQPPPPA